MDWIIIYISRIPYTQCIDLSKIDGAQYIHIVKCILVLKKLQVLCQKLLVESRFPELMYKRYCLYPPGYLVQRHLCFLEGVSLPLEARKGLLAELNLLSFHYTWLKGINSTESKHYGFTSVTLSTYLSQNWVAGLSKQVQSSVIPSCG